MIIHISGFPGSGKTTLGEKIQKKYGSKVIIYDTDGFIQHNTPEGKKLLKLENEISKGNAKWSDHKKIWKETLKNKIEEFINKYPNKIIVFVGSLDNFAPPNTIYNINADIKFVLDVPLTELMKRYYLRIYLTEHKISKQNSKHYWTQLSKGVYNISSSKDIIKNYQKYNQWHIKNNYKFKSDKDIIEFINKLK